MDSINYRDTNYHIAYDNEWRNLKKKEPEEVAKRLSAIWEPENNRMILTFFGENFSIQWEDETITSVKDGTSPKIIAAILMLNYLSYSDEKITAEGNFLSLKELKNGGALFYPAFYKGTLLPLVQSFGYNAGAMAEIGEKIGGQALEDGDGSLLVAALPKVNLKVIIWEGDDELVPDGTILFDESVSEMLHIESVIGLGMYLATLLIENKQQE